MSWDKEPPTKEEMGLSQLSWDAEPPHELEHDNEIQAALQGFGNNASFGYMPHLQAAAERPAAWLVEKLASTDLGSKLLDVPKGAEIEPDDYLKARDGFIKRQEQLKEENPISYATGSVAGIGANMAATAPLNALRAASVGGRIALGAGMGAGFGAIQNPGDVEGEIDPIQLKDRGLNAGIGAAAGGGLSALAEGASVAAKRGSDYFKRLANEKAVKAAGAMKTDFNNMPADKVQAMGQDLFDEGIITPLARPKEIAERINNKQTTLLNDLENQISQADGMGIQTVGDHPQLNMENATPDQIRESLNAQSSAGKLMASAKELMKRKFGTAPESELAPGFAKIQQWLEGRPEDMTASQLQEMKVSMNKFLDSRDFEKEMAGMSKEGLKSLRSAVRQAIEDKANDVAAYLGSAGGALRETNRKLGSMIGAEKLAENAMARDSANRTIGLTDTIAGSGGLAAGAAMAKDAVTTGGLGVAMAAGNKLLRSYGDPLAATGMKALSNQLLKVPKFAAMAQNNPGAFQAMVSNLSNSPNFKKADPDWSKEPEAPIEPRLGSPPVKDEKQDRIVEILRKNPNALQYIKNPALRDAVQKRLQQEQPKDPRQSFIDGN